MELRMEDKQIIIYGGSSDISKELIKILSNDYNQFIIFCRSKNIVEEYLNKMQLKHLKIKIRRFARKSEKTSKQN